MTEEYSAEVKKLHTEMVRKLSGNLAPVWNLKIKWGELLDSLSHDNPLSQAEIQGISTMQQLFVALMDKRFIDYGKYGPFEKSLRPIHPNMASAVKQFQAKIIAQIAKEEKKRDVALTPKIGKDTVEEVGHDENEDWDEIIEDDEDKDERSAPLPETERLKLQAEMLLELSDCLGEKQKDDWAKFMTNLRVYFKAGVLADIHNVMDAFNTLKKRGHLKLGFYDVLKDMVRPIDDDMVTIIDKFSADINRGLPARERAPIGKGTKRRMSYRSKGNLAEGQASMGSQRNEQPTKKSRHS
ncbi:uncharacterized protein LOC110463466 [Mizuhopecten yessoensis]|uniref:Uncharacterized protein n=1 Tax=Mizuhopecten yessoensis TaxID=6573 RepID=A0A210PW05_MIZYE|nr:uncharacterized protein LOC110463466 [Mizuhopecten yessoensis]OWF40677.1 hypothetical protein KP79_PYT19202 [Mizuhopecten yessoensis]